ncbi:MAG: Mce-associated rane protein [Mycobacterium sp.]|nr:Mce-associated rane protein [Mycobacterium sp.]
MTDSDEVKTPANIDEPDEPDVVDEPDVAEASDEPGVVDDSQRRSRVDWTRITAYGVLPALALILAMAAGFLKYVDNSVREDALARSQSMQAATAGTIALLSYTPDKVDRQLNDARGLLTGEFLDSYTSLINEVVIPGAKQQQISAVATVPKAGSVSADPRHAVVLLFVNQVVVVGSDAPTNTASSVRVTVDKVGGKWLISEFTPV